MEGEEGVVDAESADAKRHNPEPTPADREEVERAYPVWEEAQTRSTDSWRRNEATTGDTTMHIIDQQTEPRTRTPQITSSTTCGV